MGKEKPAPRTEKTFQVIISDSIILEVILIYDPSGIPDRYQCWVETPVCDDGLCKLMALDVQWDLLGNFGHFDVLPGRPLTKWDHLEFTPEDYRKLSEILGDKRSILGLVNDVNELFDKNTKKVSETVDAVTGATRETVKNAVVNGAVYSSYTMWHVVNGPIAEMIHVRMADLKSEDLFRKFLLSDNHNYHYYALENLSTDQMFSLKGELLHMLKTCGPFVRKKAIMTLPVRMYETPEFQSDLIRLWTDFDYYSQEALMDRLSMIDIYEPSIEGIISTLPNMNEYQIGKALGLLSKNMVLLGKSSILELAHFMNKTDSPTSDRIYDFLLELSEENKQAKKIIRNHEKASN